MPGHVIRAMSRNGVPGNAVPSPDGAIRTAAPQIGFDIVTVGVATDAAGPSHAITVAGSLFDVRHASDRPSPHHHARGQSENPLGDAARLDA